MRPDLFYAIDPHWNVAGQQHVAALIEARLAADGILLGSPEQKSDAGLQATKEPSSRGEPR
jgi:hypothetical protein